MANITKRGKSYRVTVSLYKNGKYDRLTKTFPTKEDAKIFALQTELERGNGHDLASRNTTFSEFYSRWVEQVKKLDVKESTYNNYQIASGIIERLFKDIKLKNLNDIIVQIKIDEYAETHSRKTVNEFVKKVRTSLRYAYARGLISLDFTSLIKVRGTNLPKRNTVISISDMKKLRSYLLNNTEDELNILLLLELDTGLRRGEILALKHENLINGSVQVRHSLSPNSEDDSLKTEGSKRDIGITPEVFELVSSIPPKKNSEYIFGNYGFKQSELLDKLLKKLNIPSTTFHGLRDTHASFLFSQGISIEYVSKRLGHASIMTTQKYYLELMPEKKHQQEADALNLLSSL